jgi:hypothetical protein
LLRKSLPVAIVLATLTLAISAQQPAKPATAPVVHTRENLAGMYDGGQMEVGALLELKPDGHFQYELAYGAMDETAKGTWEFRDGAVFLTTVPAVKPPQFVLEGDVTDPRGGLWLKLSSGPVMEGAKQDVFLFYDSNFGADAKPDLVEVGDDGQVPLPRKQMPKFIIPQIPVYPVISKPIPITGAAGHLITIRFEPNDIGKADFRAEKLTIENGVLVMTRPDLELQLHFKPRTH